MDVEEYEDADYISCEEPLCAQQIKNNKFTKIRSGWFFTKDDKAYCPKHIPKWVKKWRMTR